MKSSRWLNLKTVLTLLSALVLLGCGAQAEAPGSASPSYHHLSRGVSLERKPAFRIPREFAGLVVPRQSTGLGFELNGEIAAIHVDEGDPVRAGQVLAELDTRLLEAARQDLQAQQSELEAQIELNRANLARAQDLQGRGFAADQQIDELTAEKRGLQARVQRLVAELQANTTRLSKSTLVAPFDGSVSRRLMDDGAVVAPGATVLQVLDDSSLEARIGVPVRMTHALALGDSLQLQVAGRPVQGQLLSVGSDVTAATLTVPLRLALPHAIQAVPGDQAYLTLEESVGQGGYWLPLTALTDGMRGLWNVYVMSPETEGDLYRLEARDVRVLWSDGERAFVDGAIEPGELAVAAGLQRLVPGQRVRLEPDVAETAVAEI